MNVARHRKYFRSIIAGNSLRISLREINRERLESGSEPAEISRRKPTARNETGAGMRIYRRGQRLGVYEAPRRRRLIDLTKPNTAATYDIQQLCATVTQRSTCPRRERERRRKDRQSLLQRKKRTTRAKCLRRTF